MIISASRRTDIPAFYSKWFINRLKEGFVFVRNPFNANQVSKIELSPDNVDCIVFWTKNPQPLVPKLKEIDDLGFKYYFQFTLNSYDTTLEQKLPQKKLLINTFKKLSDIIGQNKVIWRYDPVLLTANFNFEYHEKWFKYIAEELHGHTKKCIISFIDMYKKCERNMKGIHLKQISDQDKIIISKKLSAIAFDNGMIMESCAEKLLLSSYGVCPGKCIDDKLISKINGQEINIVKDKSQRHECSCVTSIDIGAYNTCKHECKYCYANFSRKAVENNCANHDDNSPLLTGNLTGDEKISKKKMFSLRKRQLSLF